LLGSPNEATEAAKADGKWNRKETAGRGQPRPVRVKRWGKSPPAAVATRSACQTPSRCKAKQAPLTRPAEEPGAPHREMVTLDRIRLTGLLQKSPARAGLFQ